MTIFLLLLITFILFITWFYISQCNVLKEGVENSNNCNGNRWKITRNKRPQNWNPTSGVVSFMQGEKNLLQFGVSGNSSQPKISLTHYDGNNKRSPEKTYDFPKGNPPYQWIVEVTDKGFVIWYNNDAIISYPDGAEKFDVSNICPLPIQPTDYTVSTIDNATITVENFPSLNLSDFAKQRWKITKTTRPTKSDNIIIKWSKGNHPSKEFLLQFYLTHNLGGSFKIMLTSYNIDTGVWFSTSIPFPSGEPPYEWTIQATGYGFSIIYNTVEVYFMKCLMNLSSIDNVYALGDVGDMTIAPTNMTPLSLPCSWTVNLKAPSIDNSIVWKSNTGKDLLKMYIRNNNLIYKVEDSQEASISFGGNIPSSFIIHVNTNGDAKIYVPKEKLVLLDKLKGSFKWSNFNYVKHYGTNITIAKDKEVFTPVTL